jgi:hypothetical protein
MVPVSRKMVMARLRRAVITWEPLSVRISSVRTSSRECPAKQGSRRPAANGWRTKQ